MIHIITTGGTIGGIENDTVNNKDIKSEVNIEIFFGTANVSFEYSINEAFNKDSRLINNEDRQLLAEKIQASEVDKILITHGTFTMAKTAEYLGGLKLEKTIVLVGSIILGSNQNTDAPFNLGYAVASLQFLDKGVYIAMNGEVFDWFNVYKNLEENRFKLRKL